MTDHEVLYVERIVHCDCGWSGDAEEYDQHQIDATLSETVGEFERLMREVAMATTGIRLEHHS